MTVANILHVPTIHLGQARGLTCSFVASWVLPDFYCPPKVSWWVDVWIVGHHTLLCHLFSLSLRKWRSWTRPLLLQVWPGNLLPPLPESSRETSGLWNWSLWSKGLRVYVYLTLWKILKLEFEKQLKRSQFKSPAVSRDQMCSFLLSQGLSLSPERSRMASEEASITVMVMTVGILFSVREGCTRPRGLTSCGHTGLQESVESQNAIPQNMFPMRRGSKASSQML